MLTKATCCFWTVAYLFWVKGKYDWTVMFKRVTVDKRNRLRMDKKKGRT